MSEEEIEGIVLFVKPHREKDYLVKIFTNRFGPLMFFVRGSRRNDSLHHQLIPLTVGTFYADIRKDGLSFIQAVRNVEKFPNLQMDIMKNAYGTYLCMLTDAAIADQEPNSQVYQELVSALKLIEKGNDLKIIAFMFEVKRLRQFGVEPNWTRCAVCGQTEGIFDYSSKYHGILCSNHFYCDKRRFHASPAAVHILRQLNFLDFNLVGNISVQEKTKAEMKRVLDKIYVENVGIHLKSKSFIEQMEKYVSYFENDNRNIDKT